MTTDVFGLEDGAKLFWVNRWTIYRLVKEGKIPPFKVGIQWRFKRDALERWMDRQSNLEQRFEKLLEGLREDEKREGLTEKDIAERLEKYEVGK